MFPKIHNNVNSGLLLYNVLWHIEILVALILYVMPCCLLAEDLHHSADTKFDVCSLEGVNTYSDYWCNSFLRHF
jgi:hypothetical protein